MCGIRVTWWVGRHNNGAHSRGVEGRKRDTMVVKLQPLNKEEGSQHIPASIRGNESTKVTESVRHG